MGSVEFRPSRHPIVTTKLRACMAMKLPLKLGCIPPLLFDSTVGFRYAALADDLFIGFMLQCGCLNPSFLAEDRKSLILKLMRLNISGVQTHTNVRVLYIRLKTGLLMSASQLGKACCS